MFLLIYINLTLMFRHYYVFWRESGTGLFGVPVAECSCSCGGFRRLLKFLGGGGGSWNRVIFRDSAGCFSLRTVSVAKASLVVLGIGRITVVAAGRGLFLLFWVYAQRE